MKRIAVLTSGGDAPGMNAAIRATVRVAFSLGIETYGIRYGYNGLIKGDFIPLDRRSVTGIAQQGGTILKTARSQEFMTENGKAKAIANLKAHSIDGLMVLGGDGTFKGAKELTDLNVPTVGVPCTIDNDLAYTDFSIGFDTAINTVVSAVRKIRDTLDSHGRIGVIEVMGNHCGDIALFSAVGCGAESVIIPEFPWDIEDIARRFIHRREAGVESGIVLVSEGAAKADDVATKLRELTNFDIRSTVLGHVQRGGDPTVTDATLAARFAGHAVGLLKADKGGYVVGIVNNRIREFEINEALAKKKHLHRNLYKLAYDLVY